MLSTFLPGNEISESLARAQNRLEGGTQYATELAKVGWAQDLLASETAHQMLPCPSCQPLPLLFLFLGFKNKAENRLEEGQEVGRETLNHHHHLTECKAVYSAGPSSFILPLQRAEGRRKWGKEQRLVS